MTERLMTESNDGSGSGGRSGHGKEGHALIQVEEPRRTFSVGSMSGPELLHSHQVVDNSNYVNEAQA